jgi:hypothetical protein
MENFVLGYHSFAPVREKILFIEKHTSFSGNRFTLHKDEIDITWVRESSAFTQLVWKGRVIDRFSNHTDFYGFLTSATSLVEEAPELAKGYEIFPTSELELHVVAFLIDTPTLGFAKENYGRKYYTPAKRNGEILWYNVDDVENGASFNFKVFPPEVRRLLNPIEHSPTVVWNSGWDDQANENAIKRYTAMATTNEQVIGETDYHFHR